jgi:hypothetical protein
MSEAASKAVLSAHKGTVIVTREQLAALPEVIGTDTFKPVRHYDLVTTIEQQLNKRNIQIIREQLALSTNGMRLFGTMDLTKNGIEGMTAALGFRQANNRTMALQGVAGMRVFVCDNMALSGDTIVMKRRHTSGLNLLDEVIYALDQYESHYRRLKTEITDLQGLAMEDSNAKVLMADIFAQQIMPVRFLPVVYEVYFEKFVKSDEPKYAAFRDRSAWNLLNAFTEIQKEMPLTTRMQAAQDIGEIFGKLVK